MNQVDQINGVLRLLTKKFVGKPESQKEDAFGSILFTALSARTTDAQTEPAYQRLRALCPTPAVLARTPVAAIERCIKTIGIYKTKAVRVHAMAHELVMRFGGDVPSDFDALLSLPGVGRKTANCVQIYAFGIPAMCVDTHVHRITNRLGWVKTNTPEQTEMALRRVVPKKWWLTLNHTLILFGRAVCTARNPKCLTCPVAHLCPIGKKKNK